VEFLKFSLHPTSEITSSGKRLCRLGDGWSDVSKKHRGNTQDEDFSTIRLNIGEMSKISNNSINEREILKMTRK